MRHFLEHQIGHPTQASSAQERNGTSKSNAGSRAELAAFEPASPTPSPTTLDGAVSVAPLVLLRAQGLAVRHPGDNIQVFSVCTLNPSWSHAGWDSGVSAEA